MIGIREAADQLGVADIFLAAIIDVGEVVPTSMISGSVWEVFDTVQFSTSDLIMFAAEIELRRFVAVKAAHSRVIDPDASFSFSKGWTSLLADLAVELAKMDGPPRIIGGKEKMGSLILRVDYERSQMKAVEVLKEGIRKRSVTICDECGAPGRLRMGVNIAKTTCDEHTRLAHPLRDDDGEIVDLPMTGGPIYKDGTQGTYGVDR